MTEKKRESSWEFMIPIAQFREGSFLSARFVSGAGTDLSPGYSVHLHRAQPSHLLEDFS